MEEEPGLGGQVGRYGKGMEWNGITIDLSATDVACFVIRLSFRRYGGVVTDDCELLW